jgi:tetratricopeptide (TPR) repeat protein
LFVLTTVLEGIILWANRGMVTPYTQAQRYYLAEDFVRARDVLAKALERQPDDVNMLTLMGNVHRQLGDLDASEQVLTDAVKLKQNAHFARYGFGRTLLVKGQYAQAADAFRAALDAGAPAIAYIDYAEALYRAGGDPAAVDEALNAGYDAAQSEAHRALLAAYLRYRIGGTPPTPDLVVDGLHYWQANAERFAHTPYGAALKLDAAAMAQLT